MPITTSHKRALTGNDITVQVTAPAGRLITKGTCNLDGFGLPGEPRFQPPVASNTHMHLQAGGAGPFQNHTLKVTVQYDNGDQEPGQDNWQDQI